MKIIYATGQTCNQFWTYINYIVDCLENEKKIIIWKPDIVTKYFPGLLNSSFITFPLYSKILSTFIGYDRYIKLLNIIFFNKYSIFVTKYVLNIIYSKSILGQYKSNTINIILNNIVNSI